MGGQKAAWPPPPPAPHVGRARHRPAPGAPTCQTPPRAQPRSLTPGLASCRLSACPTTRRAGEAGARGRRPGPRRYIGRQLQSRRDTSSRGAPPRPPRSPAPQPRTGRAPGPPSATPKSLAPPRRGGRRSGAGKGTPPRGRPGAPQGLARRTGQEGGSALEAGATNDATPTETRILCDNTKEINCWPRLFTTSKSWMTGQR